MQIIAAEGLGVSPVEVDRILIAIAETYDVLVTVPDGGAFEFRATAQDGSGKASLYLGEGAPSHAPEVPGPDLFRMDHMNRDSRADSEYGAGLGAAYRF
jgi:FtsP/CotA-like multicopper oxidase with cupredoxin domain